MRMSVSPDVSELSPGDEVELTVKMANDSSHDFTPIVELAGLSADLWRLANPLPVIPAGEIAQTSILITVPADTPPGDRRISVTVRSPTDNSSASASTALRVGASDILAVEALPQAVSGRKGAGLKAVVHNRGAEDLSLRISGSSDGASVRFKPSALTLGAGHSTKVSARFTRNKRSWFRERRHGVVFEVRGDTIPATTTAIFVQRPVVPPVLLRSIAVLVALAVWASAVFVIFTNLAATDEAGTDTELVVDTGPQPPPPPVVLPDPDADPAALDGQVAPPVVIQGAVEGPRDPADTIVVIERVSFGDQGTTKGTGKIAASANPVALISGTVLDKVRTTTDERGRFRVASGLRSGAFYRVSALRTGFEVRSVVVSTATTTEIDLALTLIPGNGQMSGRVVDSTGAPLGGVTVEATQGQITYRTVTASSGDDVGRWTLDSLATPAKYQIIVRKVGYASQTLIVDLDGGQSLGGVDAILTANQGTIRGQITYRDEGVGAITVNLDGEGGSRVTTTLTDGPLAGGFTIPSLPYGIYLLTFSGEGWTTQSREVIVDTGDVEVAVRDLVPSTGVIQGIVAQETAADCAYPDTTNGDIVTLSPSPCGSVGVTVVGDNGTWKTTTATADGSFRFSGIPAGEYTVVFELFGYLPEYYGVVVEPGGVVNMPADASYDAALAVALNGSDRPLTPLSTEQVQLRVRPATPLDGGVIEGFLRASTLPEVPFDELGPDTWSGQNCGAGPEGGAFGITITVPAASGASCELVAGGGFKLTGVMAGVRRIQIAVPGYARAVAVVRVEASGITSAGLVTLLPRATVTLNIVGASDTPVHKARVFIGPTAVGGSSVEADSDGVEICTVERPVDSANKPIGSWKERLAGAAVSPTSTDSATTYESRTGICSIADSTGDAIFEGALGGGGVDVIVPVNAIDPTDPKELAKILPLDHRQLVRTIDVKAGENARLDLRLRRFPAIIGSIQQPKLGVAGFDRVDVPVLTFPRLNSDGFGVEFCEVLSGSNECEEFTDPSVTPRISLGDAAGLPVGQFRIDRIPPNEGGIAREFRLLVAGPFGSFSRDPFSETGIDNLAFGQDRAISVILSPRPLQRVTFNVRDAASGAPVLGAFVNVTGTTDYRTLEVPPFQEVVRLVCPSPQCGDETQGDGRKFGISPSATAVGGTYFDLGPSSEITFTEVFRPSSLDIEVVATGYEVLRLTRPVAGTEIDVPLNLIAQPRRVESAISATPALADYSGLTVSLLPSGGGVPLVIEPTKEGTFAFASVNPGNYTLRVSGSSIFTKDRLVNIEASPLLLTLDNVEVAQQLTLGIKAVNPVVNPQPVPGAQVILSRVNEAGDLITEAGFPRTLTTCTAAASAGGAVGCVAAGEATFTGLREGVYLASVSATGYVGTQSTVVTVSAESTIETVTLVRYGSLTGTVQGLPGPGFPQVPLSGAQVVLSSAASELATVSTQTNGQFTISNLAEIVSGSEYTITITFPGYDAKVINSVVISNDATTPLGTQVLGASAAVFSGTVQDGTALLAGVKVSVLVGGVVQTGPDYSDVTESDGTFSIKVPPGNPATIRFEDRDVNGDLIRPILELVVTLSGGQQRTGEIVSMQQAGLGEIAASIFVRDRSGAAAASAASATVTAIRTNIDSIGALTLSAVVTGGSGTIGNKAGPTSQVSAGTYTVTVSAAGYASATASVIVALNGAGTLQTTLTAIPRDVTLSLVSSTGESIDGVTVSATDDVTTKSAVVSGGAVSLTQLQPGAWTFSTEGGPALNVPHLDVTGRPFTVTAGAGTLSVTGGTMTRYAKIEGTVALGGYDNTLALPAYIWGVSNAALTVTHSAATADTQIEQTDGGVFVVWTSEEGAVTLEASRDDFLPATSVLTVPPLTSTVPAGTLTLLPAPRDVTVSLTSAALGDGDSDGGVDGLTLTAIPPQGSSLVPVLGSAVVDEPGSYQFIGLSPGTWVVSTSGGPALSVPHVDATASVSVGIGTSPLIIESPVIAYVNLSGEVEGSDFEGASTSSPLSGVSVLATQSAQTLSTVSAASTYTFGVVAGAAIDISWSKVGYQTATASITAPSTSVVSNVTLTALPRDVTVTVTGAPDGLELTAERSGLVAASATISGQTATFMGLAPGLWTVKSTNGDVYFVNDLDGVQLIVPVADSALLAVTISEPIATVGAITSRNIEGNITGLASGEVTITATANGYPSITQTVPAQSSGSTPYSLVGLNAAVTWTITFTTGSTSVTRFVAPDVEGTVLDQDLAAASVASIVVNLTDTAVDFRDSELTVTVTLSDPQAFPRLSAPITQTVPLAVSASSGTVTFADLVTTSGSPPFTVTVSAPGYVDRTISDAMPGTPISVELVPITRTVQLTLLKGTAQVTGATASLTRNVSGTPETYETPSVSGNVYEFANVPPGTWDLVVTGYATQSVTVKVGADLTSTIQLEGVADSIAFFVGTTEVTTPVVVVSGSAVTLTVKLLDVQGDVMPVTASATVGGDPSDVVTVVSTPSPAEFVNGQLTLNVTRVDSGSVTLTVSVNGITAFVTLTES
jgi:hypothetical protein